MPWEVIVHCETKDDGKIKRFTRTIAAFTDRWHALDFIEKCLPKENRSKFEIIYAEKD